MIPGKSGAVVTACAWALGTLFVSAGAWAQDEEASSAEAARTPAIEEVVVTAQRREQNLQDVPIAVTAATAEMLADAHVENITDI